MYCIGCIIYFCVDVLSCLHYVFVYGCIVCQTYYKFKPSAMPPRYSLSADKKGQKRSLPKNLVQTLSSKP